MGAKAPFVVTTGYFFTIYRFSRRFNFTYSFGFHHPYASNFVPLGLGGSVCQWQ